MTLQLRNLSKHYHVRGSAPLPAVADVSIAFEGGNFHTLLGPSGCGKTTLLRLIAGFEQPTRGEIVHDGRVLNHVPPYRRNFPMVFQSYALFPHMTVHENVAYGLRLRKLARTEVNARVARALALLQLEPLRDRHPAQLSGGQQQRVALARALVLEPPLILLDEPLSSLDTGLRVAMRAEIRALQRRLGITAVYVTHDQEEALAISDRLVVMNRGRVEQAGTPRDVFERPATEFVARFMGCSNILPAEVTARGTVTLLGETYALAGAEPGKRLAVVRSDTVQLGREEARHEATVEDTTFLGARVQYILRLPDGTRLSIDQPLHGDVRLLAPGDSVRFDIVAQRVHLI